MPRINKKYQLPADRYFWPWIGLYNSHVFHAYWLMTGDGLNLTAGAWATIDAPEGWSDESLRVDTERWARRLFSDHVLASCRTVHIGQGGVEWPNVNFYSAPAGRKIVAELDRLLIEAYGLQKLPLLSHLRTMRTGSSHCLWA